MTTLTCKTCHKSKANYKCALCTDTICKSCAEFLDENTFSFLKSVPEELKFSCYCINCFDEKVRATFEDYNETMEKAKDIIIYSKEQSKLTRLLKKKEPAYVVENCEDQQECLMRMSFMAVKAKFNCLVDVQFNSKKIIVGSHKKTIWSASGIPITIDPNEIRGHLDPP